MDSHRNTFLVTASIQTQYGPRPLTLQNEMTTDPEELPVVLEWTEYDRIQLGLRSEDPLAVLELDGFDGQIFSGQVITLPDPSETSVDAYPWYPGDYELSVTIGNEKWYGLFRIKPRHLNYDQLDRLRQDLERLVAGLSLDVAVGRGFDKEQFDSLRRAGKADRTRLKQLGVLQKALSEVAPALALIEREPHRRLGREYEIVQWHKSQRLDGKSFRWLSRGEWLHIPRALPSNGWNAKPQMVLAPTASQSLDTYENRVVRFILRSLQDQACRLLKAIETDLMGVDGEIQQAEEKHWDRDVQLLSERAQGYHQLQSLASEVQDRLKRLARTPFLAEVGDLSELPFPTTTLLKDDRYCTIYRWYQRVEEALVTVDTGEQFQTRTKRTATLYEYWCLFQVIEICEKLGFRLTGGDFGFRLREANRERLIPVIESGTAFWLEDDRGHRLRIVYNQPLPTSQSDAMASGCDLYIANPKNQPDIRVDLMVEGQPVRCLALDAKYRRLSNGWLQKPDVRFQLMSYAGNLYRVDHPWQSVTKVAVALHPGSGQVLEWQTAEAGRIALAKLAPGCSTVHLERCLRDFVGDIVED